MRDAPNCTEAPYAWVIDHDVATTETLRDLAIGLGAAAFGVTTAEPFPEALATLRAHRGVGHVGTSPFHLR